MNTLEIFALIFAIVVLIKGMCVLAMKKYPKKFDKMFENITLIRIFYILLVLVLGYFTLQVIGVVELVGIALFFVILFGMLAVLFMDSWPKIAKKAFKKKALLNVIMILFMAVALYALYLLFLA